MIKLFFKASVSGNYKKNKNSLTHASFNQVHSVRRSGRSSE